ncbi:LruC domain-containing protein [Rhodonellum sp.]|uniref:LruC domain-containing protein n=1 Tax=Rhodonellum sp. TaxID=2231180 RepID=UPI00272B1DBE|nr:LruC domain-containing protein [Rhodonellum sp.]
MDKDGNFSSPLKIAKNINTLYLYSASSGINQVYEVTRSGKDFKFSYEIPKDPKSSAGTNPLSLRTIPGYSTLSTNAWNDSGLPTVGLHNKFIQSGFLNRLDILFAVSTGPQTNLNNLTFESNANGRQRAVGFNSTTFTTIYEFFATFGQNVVLEQNFVLPKATSVELTFLDSDRRYNHSVGYKYKKPGDVNFTEVITFPNTGNNGESQPVLLTGHSISLKDVSNGSTIFPIGTEIGLFILERAFDSSNGSLDTSKLKISQDAETDQKGDNQNITRRFVALKYPSFSGGVSVDHPISLTNSIIVGFEQNYRADYPAGFSATGDFVLNTDYGDVKLMLTFPSLNPSEFSSLAEKNPGTPLPSMPYYNNFLGIELFNYTYHPAENAYTRVMFEDNWPSLGDADFNDMVVDYNYVVKTGTRSLIGEVEMDFRLIGVSAAYNNSFGVRLIGMPAHHSLKMTNRSPADIALPIAESIPGSFIVFKDVNTIINNDCLNTPDRTKNGVCAEAFDDDYNVKFSVVYDRTAVLADFSFSPFIYVNGNRGREINLIGTSPSTLADSRYFGQGSDDTGVGTSYSTKAINTMGFGQGLPWAIQTPAQIELPKDRVQINLAYPDLVQWATTGAVSGPGNWYDTKAAEKTNRNKGKRP